MSLDRALETGVRSISSGSSAITEGQGQESSSLSSMALRDYASAIGLGALKFAQMLDNTVSEQGGLSALKFPNLGQKVELGMELLKAYAKNLVHQVETSDQEREKQEAEAKTKAADENRKKAEQALEQHRFLHGSKVSYS